MKYKQSNPKVLEECRINIVKSNQYPQLDHSWVLEECRINIVKSYGRTFLANITVLEAVSYTHLTLPTKA